MQPVLQRELRVLSRRKETWRLRLVFGLGAAAAVGFGLCLPQVPARERGVVVLICVAVSGFLLSLFMGAYLTADAITSEKRDGTLGLLFLTPLRARQIILGKMSVHSAQVTCALLSAFPFFFVPRLLGGVVWDEVLRLLLTLGVTLMLSLSCGILWSVIVTDARKAVLATAVTMALLALGPWAAPFMKVVVLRAGWTPGWAAVVSPLTSFVFAFEAPYRWPGLGRGGGAAIYSTGVQCGLLLAILTSATAAWLLPFIWRRAESGAGIPRPAPEQPLAVKFATRRRKSARPGTAPLLWLAARHLEQPAWISPLRALALMFMGFMLVLSVSSRRPEPPFVAAFFTVYGLHFLTRVQFALSATRWLGEDRRSGALEHILIAPVPEEELVRAHHQSLRAAFRGSILALVGLNALLQMMVILFFDQLRLNGGAWAIFSVFFIGGAIVTAADFAAMRWISMREALRRPTQLRSASWVLGLLFLGPWAALAAVFPLAISFRSAEQAAMVFGFWLLACLIYDVSLITSSRLWLQPGLRHRAAQSIADPDSSATTKISSSRREAARVARHFNPRNRLAKEPESRRDD